MVVIKWKHLFAAGVAGLACGKSVGIARDNPDISKPLLLYTATSSGVGVAVGVGVALYRKVPIHIYAASMGVNFAFSSFTFFGTRHVLMGTLGVLASHSPTTMDLKCDDFVPPLTRSPPLDYLGSGTSGGITGALASILSRHHIHVIVGTGIGGVVVGILGQFLYNIFQSWRKKKAVLLHYPELFPPPREWTLNAFQSWFLGFWHSSSKVSQVETELVLLEHEVSKEKQTLEKLERELGTLASQKFSEDSVDVSSNDIR